MSDVSHACLLHAHARQDFRIFLRLSSNDRNNLFPLVHGHRLHFFLCLFCRLDRRIHIGEYALASAYVRADLKLCNNFFYNVLHQLFTYCHRFIIPSFYDLYGLFLLSGKPI